MKTFLLLLGLLSILAAATFQERMSSKALEGSPEFQKDVLDCFDGSAEACYRAGQYYSNQPHTAPDSQPEQAASDVANLYKKSCELGYAQGCTAYAMIYSADQEKDAQKPTRYYFNKGCEGGDFTACTMLKMMPEEE